MIVLVTFRRKKIDNFIFGNTNFYLKNQLDFDYKKKNMIKVLNKVYTSVKEVELKYDS